MVRRTSRHPEQVHDTMFESMIEGKRPSGRPSHSFIGRIRKDALRGGYEAPKEMASDREVRCEVELELNLRVEKKN